MAVERFRYRAQDQELLVGSYLVPRAGDGEWFAPFEKVATGSLASLGRAFRAEEANYPFSAQPVVGVAGLQKPVGALYVTMASEDEFSDDYSIAEPLEFGHLDGVGIVVDTTVGLHGTGLEQADIEPLLTPAVERQGGSIIDVAVEGAGTQVYAVVRSEVTRRGATIRTGLSVAESIQMIVNRVAKGSLDAGAAFDLVRAGRADLLVGMDESDWLEAKSRPHLVESEAGRIELAQDIARFANGESPGLLVVGLTTKRRQGRDVITSVLPSRERYDAGRYHRTLDQRIFPPVEGLIVETASVPTNGNSDGHVLVFYVPAQPEELKPFLVHGAIVGDRVEGAFISIVRRRGEHSVPTRPESIHTALAAGRALLRHGRLPER